MDAPRRRPSRVLFIALGLSVLAHAILLPFVRLPAGAEAAKPHEIDRFTLHSRPPARPKPTPPPPTPRPIVVRAVVAPKHPRVVAVVPPHARTMSTSTQSHVAAYTRLAVSGGAGAHGDPGPSIEQPGNGAPEATSEPLVEATPLTTPTPMPIESRCPGEPHDAIVTQAVTPDRPQSAAQEDAVGRVVVEVQLARDGSVAHASLHKSSGYASLDTAAIDAAAHARYAPASDGCEAISGTYLYVVDFSE